MDASVDHDSRVFSMGPVSLAAWSETDGRPLAYARGKLAHMLGGESVAMSKRLNDHLDNESLSALNLALAQAVRESRRSCDFGPLKIQDDRGHTRWFHLTFESQPDAGPRAWVGTFVDIDARKKVEEQLSETTTRLELLLMSNGLGMWDWNPQTGEVHFDGLWARMLGHGPDEIPPRLDAWESRVHPDDLDACYADLRAHLDGSTPTYENVHRMKHRDGRWIHVLDRGQVTERDREGRPVRFTSTHTDITDQRDAESAAQDATRAKGEFLATMSHEIRTPLSGILGLTQALENSTLDADQQEMLSLVKSSGEHLLVVLNDIVDVGQARHGQLGLSAAPFSPEALGRTLRGLFAPEAQKKELTLTVTVSDRAKRWFLADGHRLHQILANLLSNAVKFTDSGKVRLFFDAEPDADTWTLRARVKDTGRGIRDLDGLWEGSDSDSREPAGPPTKAGLGLSMASELIKLMGGTLHAESEVGRGTTFDLAVPVAPAEQPEEVSEAEIDGATFEDLRVLVAEDNPVNRKVAETMLKKHEVSAVFAENGIEALDAVLEGTFDLVLMDIHMPEMDGMESALRMGESLGDRRPRIVAVTADVLDARAQVANATFFDRFVAKPFKRDELVDVLRETVELRDSAANA